MARRCGQHAIPSNIILCFSSPLKVLVPFSTAALYSSSKVSNASAAATVPLAHTATAIWFNKSNPFNGDGVYFV